MAEKQLDNGQLSNEQLGNEQLEQFKKQRDEYLAGWQRARADFLNYKKEEVERLKVLIDYANIEIILRILPLLDNLYLAEKNLTAELKTNEYVKGLLQVKTQFEAFLKSFGVEPIEALGKKFDPAFHEAVSQVEDKTKDPETIIEETQKGYLINGQLLRPSKVVVVKQS